MMKKLVQSTGTIPTNASLSSSQSTDESSLSSGTHLTSKIRLFHRMISLRNSSNNRKPSISHSYDIHTCEPTLDHYSVIIHFLDETERTFYVDVS